MNEDTAQFKTILRFPTTYDDYESFINDTRGTIYRAMLSVYGDLDGREKGSVDVHANIAETEFTSELKCGFGNLDRLINIINPYFEGIEDYETCAEVMRVYSKLKNN